MCTPVLPLKNDENVQQSGAASEDGEVEVSCDPTSGWRAGLGKCRGMFNPKTSFEAEKAAGEVEIEIEEVRCRETTYWSESTVSS